MSIFFYTELPVAMLYAQLQFAHQQFINNNKQKSVECELKNKKQIKFIQLSIFGGHNNNKTGDNNNNE